MMTWTRGTTARTVPRARTHSRPLRSLTHMQGARDELLKLYNTVSGNRRLILQVFALLIAFILLFLFVYRR